MKNGVFSPLLGAQQRISRAPESYSLLCAWCCGVLKGIKSNVFFFFFFLEKKIVDSLI